jgi:hypothetical protein
MVESLERERSRSPLPLSEVMLTLHNASLCAYHELSRVHVGDCRTRTRTGTIDRLLRDLEGVLERMVAQPERRFQQSGFHVSQPQGPASPFFLAERPT